MSELTPLRNKPPNIHTVLNYSEYSNVQFTIVKFRTIMMIYIHLPHVNYGVLTTTKCEIKDFVLGLQYFGSGPDPEAVFAWIRIWYGIRILLLIRIQ